MVQITYDECKYIWDRKRRANANGFMSKVEMISYIARKTGVSKTKHVEIREHATEYLRCIGGIKKCHS